MMVMQKSTMRRQMHSHRAELTMCVAPGEYNFYNPIKVYRHKMHSVAYTNTRMY